MFAFFFVFSIPIGVVVVFWLLAVFGCLGVSVICLAKHSASSTDCCVYFAVLLLAGFAYAFVSWGILAVDAALFAFYLYFRDRWFSHITWTQLIWIPFGCSFATTVTLLILGFLIVSLVGICPVICWSGLVHTCSCEVTVQLLASPTNLVATGPAFKVEVKSNEIGSLKDAIKAKMGTNYTGNPALLQVHAWKGTGWEEKLIDDETPLKVKRSFNGEDILYGVVVPEKK